MLFFDWNFPISNNKLKLQFPEGDLNTALNAKYVLPKPPAVIYPGVRGRNIQKEFREWLIKCHEVCRYHGNCNYTSLHLSLHVIVYMIYARRNLGAAPRVGHVSVGECTLIFPSVSLNVRMMMMMMMPSQCTFMLVENQRPFQGKYPILSCHTIS